MHDRDQSSLAELDDEYHHYQFVEEAILERELLVPSLQTQLDWRYAEDLCMFELVQARELARECASGSEEEVECSTKYLSLRYLQNHPDHQGGRQSWCGVGLLLMPTPESFFVADVLDARCSHQAHESGTIEIDDEVMCINGISTLLLSSVEVEQLLLGPDGSVCFLQLASPRFSSPDGTSTVELIRHSSSFRQALI
mmetsp:Transcript_2560/g.3633  ORF Transcript_2560/g.3633 Transcript_2560/m.3633 type:complete len:197 (-) Transcript_2560:310-900(-)